MGSDFLDCGAVDRHNLSGRPLSILLFIWNQYMQGKYIWDRGKSVVLIFPLSESVTKCTFSIFMLEPITGFN